MKLTAVCVLTVALAAPLSAQIRPGFIVQAGAPFPIVADFNGDGLDDLVQEHNILINNGSALSESRSLELSSEERVVGVADVNGDHVLDLVTEERGAMVPPSVDPNARPGSPLYRLYILDESRNVSKVVSPARKLCGMSVSGLRNETSFPSKLK